MQDHNGTAPNGAGHALTPREAILEQARAAADQLRVRRVELVTLVADIDRDLRAYDKAVAALDPDAPPTSTRSPRPPGADQRTGTRIGPERMAEIEAVVRELAASDPDGNVRQIDVRKRLGLSSSIMSGAFAQLREDDVIRFAGVDRGPGKRSKLYKLTRLALRGEAPAPSAPTPDTRERVLAAVRKLGRPATITAIVEMSGCGDRTTRRMVYALVAEGVMRDAGEIPRTDGGLGKAPHAYALES